MWAVLERVALGLSWAEVEEGVRALLQEDGGSSEAPKAEDQAIALGNLEG